MLLPHRCDALAPARRARHTGTSRLLLAACSARSLLRTRAVLAGAARVQYRQIRLNRARPQAR
uniref:hypothetical protein n=1 Tax=Burkholderia diffusa TaxID=488732 RepID=UPI001CC57FE4